MQTYIIQKRKLMNKFPFHFYQVVYVVCVGLINMF